MGVSETSWDCNAERFFREEVWARVEHDVPNATDDGVLDQYGRALMDALRAGSIPNVRRVMRVMGSIKRQRAKLAAERRAARRPSIALVLRVRRGSPRTRRARRVATRIAARGADPPEPPPGEPALAADATRGAS